VDALGVNRLLVKEPPGKAGALARTFSGAEGAETPPASLVRPLGGRVRWIVDAAAAQGLPGR